MSEESQYTDAVAEYGKRSRFPTMSRYRDLMTFVKNAFADGVISDTELMQIEKAEKDILLEYQVAADVFYKMNPNDPAYGAAKRLLWHLHRCNVLMRSARDYARIKNTRDKGNVEMVERDRRKEDFFKKDDKVIKLEVATLGVAGLDLMKSLEHPEERIRADLPTIRRNLAKLSPEERMEIEARLSAMLDQIQAQQLELLSVAEVNRLLGLEKYLRGEIERVREE